MAREKLIEISMPLADGMVRWPGDPEPRIRRVADRERGDPCTLTTLAMSAHTGTHVDAPLHYLAEGTAVDAMPLAGLVGPARVVEVRHPTAVTVAELAPSGIRRGERVLFKTRNSLAEGGALLAGYVALAADAARWLAARRVRAIGIDGLSVDPPGGDAAHLALLSAGIWIIEGLRLAGVAPGRWELLCLPLRLAGAEGAPARAVLRASRREGSAALAR